MISGPDNSLTGERVVLVELCAADAAELAPLLDDPALHEFIGGEPLAEPELEARFERLAAGAPPDPAAEGEEWFNWVIRRTEDGAAVGTAQATVREGTTKLAWVVATAHQGRGYATQAARALVAWARSHGLEPAANIAPGHAVSERVAVRAGLAPTEESVDGERVWRGSADPR